LDRRVFDTVLDMLAGKYANTPIAELKARIFIDRDNQTVSALSNARLALAGAGGTIPDRGYYTLRHSASRARIGELDEEFVWETRIGHRFSLGSQRWQIDKITHRDVLVSPVSASGSTTPFWRAEPLNRSWHFSARMLAFLEIMETLLSAGENPESLLTSTYLMEPRAATILHRFLAEQRALSGCNLPHRYHIVVEHIPAGDGNASGDQCVIHTFWGGRINRPLALALESAWRQRADETVEIYPDNNQITILLPVPGDAADLLHRITSETVEELIATALPASGIFGARFRESAGRAMLIQRRKITDRLPLWMNRLKSQKLLAAVRRYPDFPILFEAWRGCFIEEFDLPILKLLLTEIAQGTIRVSHVTTASPGPMTRSGVWARVNQYMYQRDEPRSPPALPPDQSLWNVVMAGMNLDMPRLPADIVHDYRMRRQRLLPGYEPDTHVDLLQYMVERQIVPRAEWDRLVAAGIPVEIVASVWDRLAEDSRGNLVVSGILTADTRCPAEDPAFDPVHWLEYYGPISVADVTAVLGGSAREWTARFDRLITDGILVSGTLIADRDDTVVCLRDVYENLLRRMRRMRRRETPIAPASTLVLFLARYQGVDPPADNRDGFMERMTRLTGYPAPADLWEKEILPVRCRGYRPEWLDGWLRDTGGSWHGVGDRRVTFWEAGDRDGWSPYTEDTAADPTNAEARLDTLFRDPDARYDFWKLLERQETTSAELMDSLWQAAWRGWITSDTFDSIRRSAATSFRTPFISRRGMPGSGGVWFRINRPAVPAGEMERDALMRSRARRIIARYGVVFRELLDRESPGFRWRDLFRPLQRMELSGEILSGLFFHGISGIQFASPDAVAMLERLDVHAGIYSLHAQDPASVCGLSLDGSMANIPERRSGNRVVFRGVTPVLVTEADNRRLTFLIPPDDPDIDSVIDHLALPLTRSVHPVSKILVTEINGEAVKTGPYVDILNHRFDMDPGKNTIALYRRF
ncbi:hypothetical protein JXA80_11815, partial [bacterium]|nr:hypothetical protein [candidate division CSSED10-310 bacterium]